MNNDQPVKLLLVGAGSRGQVWTKVCSEATNVDLVGIVDRDLDRAEHARSSYANQDTLIEQDMERALKATQPEAVLVATPPSQKANMFFVRSRFQKRYRKL